MNEEHERPWEHVPVVEDSDRDSGLVNHRGERLVREKPPFGFRRPERKERTR